jgi:phosphopantetheine adenylyltransferase
LNEMQETAGRCDNVIEIGQCGGIDGQSHRYNMLAVSKTRSKGIRKKRNERRRKKGLRSLRVGLASRMIEDARNVR